MSSGGPPLHVLLVDDDPWVRRSLARLLRSMTFLVTDAADAAEARGLMATRAFDVTILDLGLPDAGGTALVGEFTRAYPRTPVLVLTGEDSPDTKEACRSAGAEDILIKPAEAAVLAAAVKRAVARPAAAGATPPGRPCCTGERGSE